MRFILGVKTSFTRGTNHHYFFVRGANLIFFSALLSSEVNLLVLLHLQLSLQ